MSTKITLIIDNPADPAAFEAAYPAIQGAAAALPGLVRYEAGKVFPKEDGTPTPAHRTLDLYFADYGAASRAVLSDQAAALFTGLADADGNVTGLFSEVHSA
jgi:hypothetical protein